MLAAIVVLLITFGSVIAIGLPILTALFALGVGLGVGIDYALFIVTRFRNGLDEGLEKRQAAIAAIDTAGRAVLFAGITGWRSRSAAFA